MIVYNKKILASVLLILISFICTAAQREQLPQPRPMNVPPPPPGFPIDSGLIILFIAAIILGIYMTIKLSKKSTQA